MAGHVIANEGALLDGAKRVQEARQDLTSRLNTLQSELGVLQSAWTGVAATAFQTLNARWDEEAKKLVAALDDFESQLVGSHQDYQATETEQQRTFNSLLSALNV